MGVEAAGHFADETRQVCRRRRGLGRKGRGLGRVCLRRTAARGRRRNEGADDEVVRGRMGAAE